MILEVRVYMLRYICKRVVGVIPTLIIVVTFVFFGSLSIVGVGFVKIPPQFYEKGPFYV